MKSDDVRFGSWTAPLIGSLQRNHPMAPRCREWAPSTASKADMRTALSRANPKRGKRLSLRKIAKELAEAGLLSETGDEYNTNAIKRMLEG